MTVLTHAFTPGPLVTGGVVSVSLMGPIGRFSLRLREAGLGAMGAAIGLDIPTRIGARAKNGNREIICLGPDEWLLQTSALESAQVVAECAGIYGTISHSLTDISAREITVLIEGPAATDLLTIGCPRDIDQIAIGDGCRTVVDGISVVLWRDGENRFRLDVWRSFAPHLIGLLETGSAELSA
ncbi:sarcosine oxidase subunit gamma [Thalassospira marina]|uniref:Sarcosine oxidase subunit gamma n=1 Tax=Thalassospira marina TaxID=2048283 RepID=A0A2N3KT81_9PROT|nr:sarcosine oxidase subunit gamma family protein [Thalassospira marina]PKR53768.1 sarcosine oxidase subunit gamma [Thalassospira marina]